MHHPEPPLLGSGLRGLGGMLGKRMSIDEWKMSVDQAQLMFKSLAEPLGPDERLATERALEIAICDDGHRRRIRSNDMIVRPQRFRAQCAQLLGHVISVARGMFPETLRFISRRSRLPWIP